MGLFYFWGMEQLKAYINREKPTPINTKGDFSYGDFHCKTLELGSHDNEQGKSCINPGIYICKKVGATHIPYPHVALTNVPNRTGIAIHIANYASSDEAHKSQLLGCIAVGSGYGDLNADGVPEILNSKATFDALMKALPDEFNLFIY